MNAKCCYSSDICPLLQWLHGKQQQQHARISPYLSRIWTELSGYRISTFSSDVKSCNSTLHTGYIHFETKTAGLNPDYPIRLPDIRSSRLSEHLSSFLDSGMARGIKFSQFGRIQRIHQVLIRFHAQPVLRL